MPPLMTAAEERLPLRLHCGRNNISMDTDAILRLTEQGIKFTQQVKICESRHDSP